VTQENADAPKPRARRRPDGTSFVRDVRGFAIKALRVVYRRQDRLVRLLGSSVEGRARLVEAMLQRSANEAISYWLQLVVAIGIATLGLVVGSTAVIIAAMLVAPLMGPIIALAMGLATGSPFLVLRASGRILLSVGVAIGGAAIIAVLLPFHELNSEIAARTAPTVLDLLTAGFCALAGVYASLRPGSDTAATAAGTSIGISLVPPLCASGYGLGTSMFPVAAGAALLFLTNLVAIIFVGTISFLLAGFNRVGTARLERNQLANRQNARVAAAIARRLSGVFESPAGPALRFLMPFLLLASVYVPLRQALDEVAWEVRVRAAVQDALGRERHRIVQSRVRVERHEIDVLVVLLGKAADADASRTRLDAEIKSAAGVTPRVEVLAIPDAKAFAGLESTLHSSSAPLPRSLPALTAPSKQLESARRVLRDHVVELWPAVAVGEPLAITMGDGADGRLRVRVVHLGADLEPAALESFRRGLKAAISADVEIVDAAIPADALTGAGGDLQFVSRVASGVRLSAELSDVRVCVTQPPAPQAQKNRRAAQDTRDQQLAEALRDLLKPHPRVDIMQGSEWTVRFVKGACVFSANAVEAGAVEGAPSRPR
jgi:uncharacterized hydrophobic protein (TIGR00271 family)